MIHIEIDKQENDDVLIDACNFFCTKLLGEEYKSDIEIYINPEEDIGTYTGLLEIIGNGEYEILLKEGDLKDMLVSLAHECVHIRQCEESNTVEMPEHSEMDEWEDEAYELEESLYEDYLKYK